MSRRTFYSVVTESGRTLSGHYYRRLGGKVTAFDHTQKQVLLLADEVLARKIAADFGGEVFEAHCDIPEMAPTDED